MVANHTTLQYTGRQIVSFTNTCGLYTIHLKELNKLFAQYYKNRNLKLHKMSVLIKLLLIIHIFQYLHEYYLIIFF